MRHHVGTLVAAVILLPNLALLPRLAPPIIRFLAHVYQKQPASPPTVA